MRLTKKQIAKITLLLVAIIIFNFVFPLYTNAVGLIGLGVTKFTHGVATKIGGFFILSFIDGINRTLTSILRPVSEVGIDAWNDFWDQLNRRK